MREDIGMFADPGYAHLARRDVFLPSGFDRVDLFTYIAA
jgi:hypothetical protein